MITIERKKELKYWFNNETNDEESREWRLDLTEEELMLVESWDKNFNKGFNRLIRELKTQIDKH